VSSPILQVLVISLKFIYFRKLFNPENFLNDLIFIHISILILSFNVFEVEFFQTIFIFLCQIFLNIQTIFFFLKNKKKYKIKV